MIWHAELRGREELKLDLEVDQSGTIVKATLTGVGGPEFLGVLSHFRTLLKGRLAEVPMPAGKDTASLLICEVLLKARGEFVLPYTEAELCHCRGIPTQVVEEAILVGAHSPQKVSRMTSASTACGTCRPDVESMIAFRLRFVRS